jgi:hypothetical protein
MATSKELDRVEQELVALHGAIASMESAVSYLQTALSLRRASYGASASGSAPSPQTTTQQELPQLAFAVDASPESEPAPVVDEPTAIVCERRPDAPEVPGKRRRTCLGCDSKQYGIKDGLCAECR